MKILKKSNQQVTRMWRLACVAILMLLILLGRLVNLQLIKHQHFRDAALNNCVYRLPIEPARGLIYDRHGELLAENISVFNLCWVGKSAYQASVLQELAKLLNFTKYELQQAQLNLKRARNYESVPIKKRISEDDLARFYFNKHRFPGVVVEATLRRNYPKGRVTAPIVGTVGMINQKELESGRYADGNYLPSSMVGKFGIEMQYEELLRGTLGHQEAEVGATGHIRRYLNKKAATNGYDLYLTIDYGLQEVADRALGDEQGAAVAIDPNNGEVLALVSHARAVVREDEIGAHEAQGDTKGDLRDNAKDGSKKDDVSTNTKEGAKEGGDGGAAENRKEKRHIQSYVASDLNHAIQASFPPASTAKLYYALHALDRKFINTQYQIWDPGWFKLPNNDHIYYDWTRGGGHGHVNVQKAIVESSDTFFYHLAVQMGIEQLAEALGRFGFGQVTQIDLPYEKAGLVANPQWKKRRIGQTWYTGDTVLAGIGQGFMLVTPMQQALAVATIAGRGKSFVPHLLLSKKFGTVREDTVPEARPTIELSSDKAWDAVIEAMGQVIFGERGTARSRFKAWECDYSAAGKTGEAQLFRNRHKEQIKYKVIPKHLRNHNWFVAFAPVDRPVIAIAVLSEHSNVAVATARQMLDYYLKVAKIKVAKTNITKTKAAKKR